MQYFNVKRKVKCKTGQSTGMNPLPTLAFSVVDQFQEKCKQVLSNNLINATNCCHYYTKLCMLFKTISSTRGNIVTLLNQFTLLQDRFS